MNECMHASLADEEAEAQRRPQGTPRPVLFLLTHPGLGSSALPAQPQRRRAKFGVLGVNLSSHTSWLVPCGCRHVSFLIYKMGHMEVSEARSEVPVGRCVVRAGRTIGAE